MAAQALYRRWRSQTFDEVVGQEHVTQTLRNALRDGRVAHAYLFAGPRGTGKTSTARLLAKAVNCLNEDPRQRPDGTCEICRAISDGALLDLIEIDAASNRGIDEIRDLRDRVHFSPSRARFKVYVIDEVHMLTPEAFNALLKTLEEPPPHVIFVLATTEPHKIPDTVLSRCQRFDFRRIPTYRIVERLRYILEQEGRAAEPGALEMIAHSAEGGMRDAISLMDQLLSYGGDVITESQVQAVRGTISAQAISGLVDAMVAGDTATGLGLINQMATEGIDLRQLALQLVAHLRALLLSRVGGKEARGILVDLSEEQLALVQRQAGQLDVSTISAAVRLINQASQDMRDSAQPQLVLELAWLDCMQPAIGVLQPAMDTAGGSASALLIAAASASAGPAFAAAQGAGERQEEASVPFGAAAGQPEHAIETARLPKATAPVPNAEVVETLRHHWTALLQAVEASRGGQLRGALRTLRHVVADGNDIYFAFENEFSKSVVERPANKVAVQDLISQLMGRPVRVHCQVGKQVTGVSPGARPEGELPGAREPHAHQELSEDPVVRHACQNLGAVPSRLGGNKQS